MTEAKKPDKSSIKRRLARHYHAHMPNKKSHRVLILVAFLVVIVELTIQLLYPVDRTVPFAKLGQDDVGWQPEQKVIERISKDFVESKLVLKLNNRQAEKSNLTKFGAEPLADEMAHKLSDYPFWQRLIPGSIFWQRPHVDNWQLRYNNRQLDKASSERAANFSSNPVNANLEIKDGELVATDDKPGLRVEAEKLRRQLLDNKFEYGRQVEITVPAEIVQPSKRAEDLAAVREQAESALDRPLQLLANGKSFEPELSEKATWLRLDEDEKGKTRLSLNVDKLNTYIDQKLSAEAGKKAGFTEITLENGREKNRVDGATGSKVNNEPLVNLIRSYLLEGRGRPVLTAEMVDVAPQIRYNNTYTATREGLQAYISAQARNGAWISVRQLDGANWTAGADDGDSVVSASTYKLYISLYLFKEMDEGKRNWGTPILDTNTSACFDRMTIASTNPCAEEWLNQFGRANLNNFLYDKGFSQGTTFTHPEAAHTSAADLAKFMVGLERGTLVGGAHRDRLMSSLSRHSYRSGIPAGSAGRVWNKVGFLWDYVNDAAIVHHPKGRYVLVIMTKGKSYAAIAAMTREIEKIMYP